MATVYGDYTGSGNYWRTYLTYSTSNPDGKTTKITATVGVNHKAIPTSVASKWGKSHDPGWVKIANATEASWSEGSLSGSVTVSTAGSFALKSSVTKSFTRTCTATTKSIQGRNYHSGAGNTPKLTGTSTTSSTITVTIPARPRYTITFNNNGGSGSSPTLKCAHCSGNHKSYGYSASIVGSNPTRSNYTFLGWYTAQTGGTRITSVASTVNSDTTYYAHWAISSYTVSYVANGSNVIGTMSTTNFNYGTFKSLPYNKFSRVGYKFIGWSRSSEGEVVYKDHQLVGNLTTEGGTVYLYAQWEPYITGDIYVKNNDNKWLKAYRAFLKTKTGHWIDIIDFYEKNNDTWRDT